MKLPKYKRVAELVRKQVIDGRLVPGASAPSGAELARVTGYSPLTCRRALRALVQDGVLVPGISPGARPRVPVSGDGDLTLEDAERELSAALADRRRAAGLTQPQLAEMADVSVTTVGHAETGRLWQSREFWECADKALDADGELIRLYNAKRAAEGPDPKPQPRPALILIVWTDGGITTAPVDPRLADRRSGPPHPPNREAPDIAPART
jgi:DNA-binding XRE family transcriptional regulator